MGRKLLLYGFGLWTGATLLELSHIVCIFVSIQGSKKQKVTTPAGFEPALPKKTDIVFQDSELTSKIAGNSSLSP